MPIYEYKCEECDSVTEAWQNITEDPLTCCPKCEGTLRKLISTSSFHLKGGGWYADGYGDSKKSTAPKPESTTAPKKPESSEKSCKENSKQSCPCAS